MSSTNPGENIRSNTGGPSTPGPNAAGYAQKPSICRVVVYHHSGSKDGRYPPMVSPAIVQSVSGENPLTIKCVVFSKSNGFFFADDIKHISEVGSGETCWSWPERI